MSRWLLTLLALSAVTVAVVLAIARPGALSHQGTFTQPVAAFADAEPSATPWAYIDKVQNGDGWCDPTHIDTTSTEYVGDAHQFALCVGNLTLGHPVHSFQATISYDGTLDECIDEHCQPVTLGAQTIQLDQGCVDDNPDANENEYGDGLGAGWDCFFYFADGYSLGVPDVGQDPTCDVPDHGSGQSSAGISCHGTYSYTLGDDETWGALAVINMNVIAAGVDNVDIQTIQVRDSEVPIIVCPVAQGADVNADSVIEEPCQGATDIKRQREHHRSTPEPSPTSTATPEPPTVTPPPPPPPTATPSGGVGPEIVAPATGSGPSDGGAPWAVWLAVAVAGTAAAAGGLYLRFAKGRRRGSG